MKNIIKEYALYIVCVLFIGFIYFKPMIKRLLYPYIYGQKTDEVLEISKNDYFEDVSLDAFVFKRKGKSYLLEPKTIYAVTGRVGIVDNYDTLFEQIYRAKFQGDYMTLVPRDVFLVIGSMAEDGIFQKFLFEHEERMGRVLCAGVKYKKSFMPSFLSANEARKNEEKYRSCQRYINQNELNNYHPIPASENINKALMTLKKGDEVYMEGYLVDVPTLGLKTGTRKNQYHENIKIGAFSPGMCFVLYTTKVITRGRVYE